VTTRGNRKKIEVNAPFPVFNFIEAEAERHGWSNSNEVVLQVIAAMDGPERYGFAEELFSTARNHRTTTARKEGFNAGLERGYAQAKEDLAKQLAGPVDEEQLRRVREFLAR
jgi:hypothetical protein